MKYKLLEDANSEAIKEVSKRYITAHLDFAIKFGLNVSVIFDKLVRLHQYLAGCHDDNGDHWVRMTFQEWQQEFPFWSPNTTQRAVERAVKVGVILTRTFKGRSKYYRCHPDYWQPDEVLPQNGVINTPKWGNTLPQNGVLPNSSPNSSLPIIDPSKKSPEKNNKPKQYTPQQIMFGYLARLYKIDLDIELSKKQKNQLRRESEKLLTADKNPDDIRLFEEWWYKHDWRGQKGQVPQPGKAAELWGQFEESRGSKEQQKSEQPRAWNDSKQARLQELLEQERDS